MINPTIKMEQKESVNSKVSPAGTHPLVLGIVTICDVGHGPGRVQGFGVFYQRPAETNIQHLCKCFLPQLACKMDTTDLSQHHAAWSGGKPLIYQMWPASWLSLLHSIQSSGAFYSPNVFRHVKQEEFLLAACVIQTCERNWNVANSISVLPTFSQSVFISLKAVGFLKRSNETRKRLRCAVSPYKPWKNKKK